MEVRPSALLAADYLAERARSIDPRRAGAAAPGVPGPGDTVYLAAADAEGRMVSFIQSNFFGFGSGIVVPGTGISLQNRGSGFSLEEGHPNRLAPGKRPFHTIIPGFVTDGGRPRMAFGVMGGAMQPQGHLQMMLRVFGHGQNPQAASDAPRWQVMDDGSVGVEREFDPEVVRGLEARGHRVQTLPQILFGGAQLIYRLDEGGHVAGSDHRKDGQAVAF
jgi:gamma-glutamyltranspeptidase/glutathione hydrolase